MNSITFQVAGTPTTTTAWRDKVAQAALGYKPVQPWTTAIGLVLVFSFKRVPISLRDFDYDGEITSEDTTILMVANASGYPFTMTSPLSLAKTVIQGLIAAKHFVNESQVCELVANKLFSQEAGVQITVIERD